MNTFMVITQRMHYHCDMDEALRLSLSYEDSGEPVAIMNGTEYLYESHPDDCLFCGNLKTLCVCDQD